MPPATATAASPVETRLLAPPASEDDSGALLYREVPQIEGDVPMRPSFVEVTPEQAREWLYKADEEESLKQRHTSPKDVRRWKILMDTGRFVQYLPDGPLCFDDDGILLNGKHRLTAVVQHNKPIGFMVVKHVPRWMFRFFDTGRGRTLKDMFNIAGMASNAQTGSTMRLAMRYEEFLRGLRSTVWHDWRGQRDEHADVEDFMRRREDLHDWYYVGQQIYGGAKVISASSMVFRFYQSLAWPDGEEKIVEFCEGLARGAMLAPQHPALVLREWTRESFNEKEKIKSKRELHLLLLLRHFEMSVNGTRIPKLRWARGMPMPMPYHPGGHEVAVENVLKALEEMDGAAS
jgi:hypothetical protein